MAGELLRRQLAEGLWRGGVLTDPRWRQAFADVPREVFLRRFFVPEGPGWAATTAEERLDHVYADRVMVTQLDDDPQAWDRARRDGPVPGTPTSSSSMPTIMAVMLEELRVADDDRVLEIGTGTGYNAALLCHRLGAERVVTVDIDPDLVTTARAALTDVGYEPICAAHDGALGYPPRAPYDRVLGTCSVSRIPLPWLEQTRPGGQIITTLHRPIGAGLVRIVAGPDGTGQGRVLPPDGRFMPLRADRLTDPLAVLDERAGEAAVRSETSLPVSTVVSPSSPFEFFAGLVLTDVTPVHPPDGNATYLVHPDGSWAHHRQSGGGFTVEQGGPRRLWDAVERAHADWQDLGKPGRADFGVTVTPDRQEFWLGSPDGPRRWAF
jgi:methyltransferase of ATP-grasp peptide maturase system